MPLSDGLLDPDFVPERFRRVSPAADPNSYLVLFLAFTKVVAVCSLSTGVAALLNRESLTLLLAR